MRRDLMLAIDPSLFPENERLEGLQDENRVVVSEPLADLNGAWEGIEESTVLVVQRGPDVHREFRPQVPAQAAAI